jgi:hypothetical protein
MTKKFDFAEFYMKYGFWIITIIVIILFIVVWRYYLTKEEYNELQSNQCFSDYACKSCIFKSYCEELGLEYNQKALRKKIICSDNLQNLTSIDYTFTIIDEWALYRKYSNCEDKSNSLKGGE